jgi:hypothetical protein
MLLIATAITFMLGGAVVTAVFATAALSRNQAWMQRKLRQAQRNANQWASSQAPESDNRKPSTQRGIGGS